ncbi:MAG TPA: hypothetical protein VH040_11080 [Usitatibacter sp.]|nr:hypothetical protein [Usitatibacter sp.]
MAEATSITSKMPRKLDRTRHFVTVHGREESSTKCAAMQDGIYFDDGDQEIVEVPPAAKMTEAEAKRRAEEDAREIAHRKELAAGVGKR